MTCRFLGQDDDATKGRALERIPTGKGPRDGRPSGHFLTIMGLVDFWIKSDPRFGFLSGQPEPADGIQAGGPELSQLVGQRRLAAPGSGLIQRKGVVEHMHQDLQGFLFAAPEFIEFQTEGLLFLIVKILKELSELSAFVGDFRRQRAGRFFNLAQGLTGMVELGSGTGHLLTDPFQVPDLS